MFILHNSNMIFISDEVRNNFCENFFIPYSKGRKVQNEPIIQLNNGKKYDIDMKKK